MFWTRLTSAKRYIRGQSPDLFLIVYSGAVAGALGDRKPAALRAGRDAGGKCVPDACGGSATGTGGCTERPDKPAAARRLAKHCRLAASL